MVKYFIYTLYTLDDTATVSIGNSDHDGRPVEEFHDLLEASFYHTLSQTTVTILVTLIVQFKSSEEGN